MDFFITTKFGKVSGMGLWYNSESLYYTTEVRILQFLVALYG